MPPTHRGPAPAGEGSRTQLIHETPIDGAGGKLVAFLHPKSTFGVLTEFCTPKEVES